MTTLLSGQGKLAPQRSAFPLGTTREPVSRIDVAWRFHTGDDMRWAEPAWDDSGWRLMGTDRSWSDQGLPSYGGTAWYRIRIEEPAEGQPLALYLPAVMSCYQIFLNGKLAGTVGDMPPKAAQNASMVPRLWPLPVANAGQSRVVTVALRVWDSPHWSMLLHGGLLGGIRVGERSLLQERMTLETHDHAWQMAATTFLAMLEFLAGLGALALYAMLPQERESLWFGIWLTFSAAIRCLSLYTAFHPIAQNVHDLIWQTLFLIYTLASIAFYFRLLRGRQDWLFWLAIGCTLFNALLLTAGIGEWISVILWVELGTALTLPVSIWIMTLLIGRVRENLPDAKLLLAPVMMQQLLGFLVRTRNLGVLTRWFTIPWMGWLYTSAQWPFPFSASDVADGLFLIAMLVILIYRFTRTRSREENFGREREAARTVQQVLIPEEPPQVPGFAIVSVYRPAGEVGGDFFQVIPLATGGMLVAIGDVSGKGLPAALTVSLLVGTVRTLANYSNSPGEMLTAINRRMVARSSGGFTTCLILRADLDGTVTVANAGHLPPYKDGVEMTTDFGLPLGLNERESYAETRWMLKEHEQLTLLTDGVVEARNKAGELFGFERTLAISGSSAEAIAQAAQEFGQEDDITALTIVRVGVAEAALQQP